VYPDVVGVTNEQVTVAPVVVTAVALATTAVVVVVLAFSINTTTIGTAAKVVPKLIELDVEEPVGAKNPVEILILVAALSIIA
jgi:hypothetical protein